MWGTLFDVQECCEWFAMNWWWWLFPRLREFGENVRPFIPSLPSFFFPFFFFFSIGDYLTRTNFTLYARINPQWLSELRRLAMNYNWRVHVPYGCHVQICLTWFRICVRWATLCDCRTGLSTTCSVPWKRTASPPPPTSWGATVKVSASFLSSRDGNRANQHSRSQCLLCVELCWL